MDEGALIEQVYGLAEDERCWPLLLPTLASAMAAPRAHIFVLDGEQIEENHNHAIPETTISRYHAEFQGKDPRMVHAVRHTGRVFSDVDIIPREQWERSRLYNELLIYDESRYTMFVNLPVQDNVIAAQAFMRSEREGHFTRDEVHRFERILPHIARAIRLRRVLTKMKGEVRGARAALDRLPTAILVLDEQRRIVCDNERAHRLLRDGQLTVQQQRLTSSSMKAAAAIASSHAATMRLVEPGIVVGTAAPPVVTITRGERAPLTLIFLPLHARHRLREAHNDMPRVLVVVHDPEECVRLDPELVARLYGFTSTEALLAVELCEGHDVAAIAARRQVSAHTVRTHLKRLLDKTGTHRQAELVRTLLGSTALHLATSTTTATSGAP